MLAAGRRVADQDACLAEAAVAAGEPVLPPRYHALARLWFWLGWPAFLWMLMIFWLMIAKPV